MNLEELIKSIVNIKDNIRKTKIKLSTAFLLSASTLAFINCRQATPIDIIQLEIKEDITNPNGEVIFEDNNTREEVRVIVQDNNRNGLEGINVIYYDGNGYEIFTAIDPSETYLPTRGIYSHNSIHVLKTIRADDELYQGILQIGIIENQDTLQAYSLWKRETNMTWRKYTYLETINLEDKVIREESVSSFINLLITKDIESFLIDLFFNKILTINSAKIDEMDQEIDFGDLIRKLMNGIEQYVYGYTTPPERWDIYSIEQGLSKNSSASMFYTVFIPSNIPKIEVNQPIVNEDRVFISWQGFDNTTYPHMPMNFPDNTDITIFLGPTTEPDLYYELRLFKEETEGLRFVERWRSLISTSKTIENLDTGSYAFEVAVFDEIGNGEISERTHFTIGIQPRLESLIIQPGPEGKDSYVAIGYENGIPTYFLNENFGNVENLHIGHEIVNANYNYTIRSYIQFDLSTLSSNININSAMLYLYGNASTENSFNIQVRKILEAWAEDNITWNNQPQFSALTEAETNVTQSFQWYSFDIRDLVRSWYSQPSTNHGLLLKHPSEIENNLFNTLSSDETNFISSYKPKLIIEYTTN